MRLFLLAVLASGAAACASDQGPTEPIDASRGQTRSYAAVDFGAPGLASEANGINAAGQVVGYTETATGEFHAAVWTKGVMTDLGTLGGNFVRSSRATDINASGQIVGVSTTEESGSFEHAVVWNKGMMTDLGAPGVESQAVAINPQGQVVGFFQPPAGDERAVLWSKGTTTELGTLGGSSSAAVDINESGQIVGRSQTAGGQLRAFLWNKGAMRNLGTLGGSFSAASAINAAGQIVGTSATAAGETHGFIWSKGVMTDLGALPGCTQVFAVGINASAQVVGWCQASRVGFAGRAFMWQDGVMTDLGALAPPTNRALAINNAGQVVGSSATESRNVHATLWIRR